MERVVITHHESSLGEVQNNPAQEFPDQLGLVALERQQWKELSGRLHTTLGFILTEGQTQFEPEINKNLDQGL